MEEIQIADIEQELAQLWEKEKTQHQSRATLFTLVLYSPTPKREAHFEDFLHSVVEKFPCRIIWVQANKDPSLNFLKVTVSNLLATKGEKTLACDLIKIEVTDSQIERVPFIILPHLIADLPIYLLWGESPASENRILPHLLPLANKLILDSECIADLSHFSREIVRFMETRAILLSDINWVAIGAWRKALAQTFNTEERLSQLRDLKAVRLLYNRTTTNAVFQPEIPALYFQAWLAAQLNWHLKSAALKDGVIQYQNVAVELATNENPHIFPGTILMVEMQTNQDHFFNFNRIENPPQVVVHISTAIACDMPFTLPLRDLRTGQTFLRELLYKEESSLYAKTLAKLGEIP